MDKIEVDLTVTCAYLQLGPKTFVTVYTDITDCPEVIEQLGAERLGWA